jgi:hypothetical protein
MAENVSNMLQPFWAVPVVAIAGVRIQRVMGYTAIKFVVSLVIYAVTDSFPKGLVGSAMGFGGAAGAIGGMFIATFAGYLLQATEMPGRFAPKVSFHLGT